MERSITSINTGDTKGMHTTLDDLKLKLAEHIIAQYGGENSDVRSILTETKVGAWRRKALLNKLKMVFLAA